MVQYQFFLTGCELVAKQSCSVELRVQEAQVRKKGSIIEEIKQSTRPAKGTP